MKGLFKDLVTTKVSSFLAFALIGVSSAAVLATALGFRNLPSSQIAPGLAMQGKVLGLETTAPKFYLYPSNSLVNDNGTIYFISGTVKVPFTSSAAFKGLGYSSNNVIDGDLTNYTLAKSYTIGTASAEHPWGSWLVYKGNVYYSTSDGLISVPSPDIFANNGGYWNMVVKANQFDIAALEAHPNLPPLTMNDPRVYGQNQALQLPQPPNSNTQGPAPKPITQQLSITKLFPASGLPGTVVTITGSGFTVTDNKVRFGDTGTYIKASYIDPSTLTFMVPGVLANCKPDGSACDSSLSPVSVNTSYNVIVVNSNAASNPLSFKITDQPASTDIGPGSTTGGTTGSTTGTGTGNTTGSGSTGTTATGGTTSTGGTTGTTGGTTSTAGGTAGSTTTTGGTAPGGGSTTPCNLVVRTQGGYGTLCGE